MSEILLEAVAGSVDEALAAEQAGADRIELCSALPVGGLTPSLGMVRMVCRSVKIPVAVMIRSREGGFVFSPAEISAMVEDAKALADAGARDFVFACLGAGGKINAEASRAILGECPGKGVFHRAFDDMDDPAATLDQLIELGFGRILTSGGEKTALEGAERIRSLVVQAADRVEILPGGGVRPHNAAEIVRQTGVSQLHFSARIAGGVGYDGFADPIFDSDRVRQMREAVQAV